jgi:hypothetical protein
MVNNNNLINLSPVLEQTFFMISTQIIENFFFVPGCHSEWTAQTPHQY